MLVRSTFIYSPLLVCSTGSHGFLLIPRCAPETLEIPSPVWPGNPTTGAKRRSGETKILRRETWFRYLETIVLQMDHIVLRI